MLLISNKFDKLVIRLASFNHSMRYKREKKKKECAFFFFFLIVLRIVVPYKQRFIAQQRQKIIRGK